MAVSEADDDGGVEPGEVALKATPLILCALGLAVCYRSNVWNIGAEGQMLLGAVAPSFNMLSIDTDTTQRMLAPSWTFLPTVWAIPIS